MIDTQKQQQAIVATTTDHLTEAAQRLQKVLGIQTGGVEMLMLEVLALTLNAGAPAETKAYLQKLADNVGVQNPNLTELDGARGALLDTLRDF